MSNIFNIPLHERFRSLTKPAEIKKPQAAEKPKVINSAGARKLNIGALKESKKWKRPDSTILARDAKLAEVRKRLFKL